MHQALLIPEVLLEIFSHVTEEPSDSSTGVTSLPRKSLAALATICKAFYEPAMDLLWSEIDISESMLGCITRLHPLKYRSGRLWNWLADVRPLSVDEAHQFLRHSARVRSLIMLSTRLLHLFSDIPVILYDFPRLMSLTISTKYLNFLLSQTLHHHHLATVNEDLQSIVTRFAALERLSIITPDTIDAVSTARALSRISDVVRLCKQLVTLSSPLFDWAAWKHISNLSTLTRVDVGDTVTDATPPSPLERDITNFSPFSNVTTLSFLLYGPAYAITVMQHSQFPSLKEFKIDVRFISSPEAEQLFRALSKCKACEILQKIVVYSSHHEYNDPQTNSLSYFLCFTQLRTLDLACFDFCINLDDDILLEAASAWPHMRNLEIEDSRLHHSLITFRGIFTMLRLCPQLDTLRISIDTTTVDIDPDVEPVQHTSLRILELKTSGHQIPNAGTVARIIFSYLPRINGVGGFIQNEWDEVNMHLKSLKDAAPHATGAASNT
ncbi:uncharacterized protein HD556DRAFT_1305539 [Suillus plorans]|uniref:F-box domain-containing protein n=1 Tax=Suillus plorans TaxID=116603 RepID=A0A9P7J218_9AGAM|nr:uncharacterized protein HD556DRAFT_1305539 [Suillus plorans]KAG1799305.1 hypothetical protein HD556DRAFT_1305539 [Suillus plorans]